MQRKRCSSGAEARHELLLHERLLVEALHRGVAARQQRTLRHAADRVVARRRALFKRVHARHSAQPRGAALIAKPAQCTRVSVSDAWEDDAGMSLRNQGMSCPNHTSTAGKTTRPVMVREEHIRGMCTEVSETT